MRRNVLVYEYAAIYYFAAMMAGRRCIASTVFVCCMMLLPWQHYDKLIIAIVMTLPG